VPLALDVELHDERVVVGQLAAAGAVLARAQVVLHPAEALGPARQRHEAEAVREHLVLHDRRVVVEEDVLDGDGRHVGHHDAPEGVGDGRVDADEREGRVERGRGVELDAQLLAEALGAPRVVFAGIHAWVFRVARVLDGLGREFDEAAPRQGVGRRSHPHRGRSKDSLHGWKKIGSGIDVRRWVEIRR
jgi:hypothetical protein